MLVKVSGNPEKSLVSQGFQIRKIKDEDYLAKGGKYFRCPRSVERALKANSAGRKIKPFRFLLKEANPTIDNRPKTKTLVFDKSYNLPVAEKCCQANGRPQAKFILTDGVISFYHNGVSHQTSKSNPMFDKVVASLKSGDIKTAVNLCNIASAIEKMSDGLIKNNKGTLQYSGENIHESASEWIMRNLSRGNAAVQPIINFLGRVKANDKPESVEGLWRFIRECGLVITSEGKFICQKYTDDDFMDCHSRTIHYSLGKTIEMKREDVEFDPNKRCGRGIHGASENFVRGHSTIIELMIDPIDVISVPYDSSSQKLRCCRAFVWRILKHKGQVVNEPTKQEEFFVLS